MQTKPPGKGGRGKAPNRGGGKAKGEKAGKKLSHALSWALRHAALDIGLTMSPGGWVPVQEILDSKHPRLKGATLPAIEDIVATSDKQRFALSVQPKSAFPALSDPRNDNNQDDDHTEGIFCIRANQGHSIQTIDPSLLLQRLSPESLLGLPCIVHGTNNEAWASIAKEGLSKRNRTHIHFATGLPTDGSVISGMRKSCSVYIYVDPARCCQDGLEFFRSENGVVLTAGVAGILAPKYFLKVTDSQGKLLQDQIPQD